MNNEPVNSLNEVFPDVNTEDINDQESSRSSSNAVNHDDLATLPVESADPIEDIKRMLESKSAAKQTTFHLLTDAFKMLSNKADWIVKELIRSAQPADQDVTLYHKSINKHEFHVKLAGDLLIFVMHTNIVTFDDEHGLMKDAYIRQNDVNRYFGQINIYNFMYDSLRYDRGNDPGYLIGRLMINHENRFFMEGEKSFINHFGRISSEPVSERHLEDIVKKSLQIAIRNDLMALPYAKVRSLTLNQKNEHTIELGGGQKIGFQMSYQTSPGA